MSWRRRYSPAAGSYGTNIVNLLKLLTPEKDGQLTLDFDDVVQRGITCVHNGESMWPPPEVKVSAAPAAPQAAEPTKPAKVPVKITERGRISIVAATAAVLFGLIAIAPAALHGSPAGVRAGDRDRRLCDRKRAPRSAHAVDVGDQRDLVAELTRKLRHKRLAANGPTRDDLLVALVVFATSRKISVPRRGNPR